MTHHLAPSVAELITFLYFITVLCDVVIVLLCLLYRSLGKGEAIETTLAALQVVPEPFRSFANTLVDICAYAGQSFAFEFVILLFGELLQSAYVAFYKPSKFTCTHTWLIFADFYVMTGLSFCNSLQ